MKKLILLLSLIVNSILVNAQYKKMLADSNHYWYQYNQSWYSPTSPFLFSLYQLKNVKDTVINSKNYHKVKPFSSIYNNSQGGFIVVKQAFLREDTLAKKVYYYNFSDARDYLLYDFSKQLGDTIKGMAIMATPNSIMQYDTSSFKVITIDSLLLGDSKYHRRFSLISATIGGTYTVIEGVGSNSGLLNPYIDGTISDAYYLMCYGYILPLSKVYTNPMYNGSCNLTIGLKNNSIELPRVSLYPNPTQGNFAIDVEGIELSKAQLSIINATGQLVFYLLQVNQSENIDISFLPTGVYCLKIQTANNHKVLKLIKE
jgi:hypothetical protein